MDPMLEVRSVKKAAFSHIKKRTDININLRQKNFNHPFTPYSKFFKRSLPHYFGHLRRRKYFL
jgi:hypothetical protein